MTTLTLKMSATQLVQMTLSSEITQWIAMKTQVEDSPATQATKHQKDDVQAFVEEALMMKSEFYNLMEPLILAVSQAIKLTIRSTMFLTLYSKFSTTNSSSSLTCFSC